MSFKVVDLFAGSGGMSLGFQETGFEILAAFDNWDPAILTYKHNFNHPIYKEDLSQKSSHDKIAEFNADVIIGGPPCQDFSIAGKRDVGGLRANLTISFAEIVSLAKPKMFVMENVATIVGTEILENALNKLRSNGYGVSYAVIDASYLKVPQARKRFFAIGIQGGPDDILTGKLLHKHSAEPMSVKEYFGKTLETEFYYSHPRSYNRRAIFSVHEPSSTVRGVNRPVPATYKIHSGDKSSDISKVRPLTTEERAQLQTFPKEFEFCGSKAQQEQQIGNAVPVNMAKHVAQIVEWWLRDNR